MATEENKAVVRNWVAEVINGHDSAAVARFFAPDIVSHQAGGTVVRGIAAWQALVTEYLTAFSDYRSTVESIIGEREMFALRWTATGTQTGPFRGIAPTGEAVSIQGLEMDRVVDGKVVETWSEFDWHGVLHQLGRGMVG